MLLSGAVSCPVCCQTIELLFIMNYVTTNLLAITSRNERVFVCPVSPPASIPNARQKGEYSN